jgi:hypothetical protein
MTDDTVSFRPIANDRATSQYQFWVGYAVARSLGEPPYPGAQALAANVLKRSGQCRHGVAVVPSSFHDPGNWGLAFVVECKAEKSNQDARQPLAGGSRSEP